MKSTITTTLIQATIAVSAVFVSFSVQASSCSLRNDIVKNTQALGEFVKAEMNPFKKAAYQPKAILEEYTKIDRNSGEYPALNTLNSGGILTAKADVNVNKLMNNTQGYGQAIQITKCHWITNLHVAEGIAKERNESLEIGSEAFGSFAQGAACTGKDSFKAAGVPGKLVAFNKSAFFVDENGNKKIDDSKDWAFYQTTQSMPGVPVATLSKYDFLFGRSAIIAGNPFQQLDKDEFGVTGVNVVKAQHAAGPGVMVLQNRQNWPGRSGAGVFLPDSEDGLVLAAIYVGSGNVLNVSEVFNQLKVSNPAVFKDIVRVLKGGDCR